MKIVYICKTEIPSRNADTIQVMKQCQALTQLGHDVTLFAPALTGQTLKVASLWEHYGIEQRFPIVRLASTRLVRLDYYALLATQRALEMKPEVIWARCNPAALVTAKCGIPTIAEVHEPPASRAGLVVLRQLLNSSRLKLVVAISAALKARLVELNDPGVAPKIGVFPDAVDLEHFQDLPSSQEARRELGWPMDQPLVGYAGHLYEGRGIDLLFDIAAARPNYGFAIVGGNLADVEKYQAVADSRGLRNVYMVGFVQNSLLPQYLAACDLLVMPYSRTVAAAASRDISQWMSPMKLFEYMAAGRAILCSDLPVLHEVLTEDSAIFCEPGNLADWLVKLDSAVSDHSLRQRISHKAQADVQRYSWRNRGEKVLAAIV